MIDESKQIDEVFWEALQIQGADERATFLAQACGDDEQRRRTLEKLIAAGPRVERFLEKPFRIEAAPQGPPMTEKPGSRIGPYELGEQIGEGGFGIVYVAEQQEPVARKVALKIIKPGMDTRDVIARFEAERQALALMDHPNVAKVLDAGATESGRPYFVMELVHGLPITEFCDERKLTNRERLQLFVDVCRAVQHAHQKGIIHRDLKPSNVLVTLHDERPVPKVIDFGVSKALNCKLTDKSVYTAYGQMIGTPLYMSPEQAQLSGLDVDTRSDVYSLGVLLYELLTGTTPFDKETLKEADFDELRRIIREEEPPRPSARVSTLRAEQLSTISDRRKVDSCRLSQSLRGEADWIVMKAMEKDRNRRYESASALAADVGRLLTDEPVLACPPSGWYRFNKWARRHRTSLAAAAVVTLAALVVVGVLGWVARDRAAQRELVRNEVTLTLAEARTLRAESRSAEARAAIRHVEGLLDRGGLDEGLHRAVSELSKELRDEQRDQLMLARLDEAKIEGLQIDVARNRFALESSIPAYEAAFRAYGMDCKTTTAQSAARRIRSRPAEVQPALIEALDYWVALEAGMAGKSGWTPRRLQWLAAVLAIADPDPWRTHMRAAARQGDTATLAGLAQAPDIGKQEPSTLCQLGVLLCDAGQRDAGLAVLRRAQLAYPADFMIATGLAAQLARANTADRNDEFKFSQIAVALRPKSAGSRFNLGQTLRRLGRWDEAISEYRQALELRPDYFHAHLMLGALLSQSGRSSDAIDYLQRALALRPESALAHTNLGIALTDTGQLEKAIAEHREALAIDPDLAVAHLNLGVVFKEQGDLDRAITEYNKAIELDPDLAEAHANLGNLLFEEEIEPDQAAAAFQKAIELKLYDPEIYTRLAALLGRQGKYDEAIAASREAIRLKPTSPAAHKNLGIDLRESGRLEEAVAALQESVELKKDDWAAHYNLGLALDELGRAGEALAAYRAAIELQPDSADAYGALGVALARHRPEDAIAAYRQAIELNPDVPKAWLNFGAELANAGRLAESIQANRKALELDPNYATAYANLGAVLSKQGKPEEAVGAYRKAIELRPDDANAYYNLGLDLRTLGRLDQSVAALRRAIAIEPAYFEAHNELGLALRDLGDTDAGIAAFRRAIAANPSCAEAHCNLAGELFNKGRFAESLEHAKLAHELGSKRPDWRFPSAEMVKLCETMARRDALLSRVRAGKQEVADPQQRLMLAEHCCQTRRFELAFRLYRTALDDPESPIDRKRGGRFLAAVAAALASARWGEDAGFLSDEERSQRRRRALEWLRADLSDFVSVLETDRQAGPAIAESLQRWLHDDGLRPVRGAAELARLPAEERAAFVKLWSDVRELLDKAKGNE